MIWSLPAFLSLSVFLSPGFAADNSLEEAAATGNVRSLMISVRNNNDSSASNTNGEWSGGIRKETIYIGTGKPPAPPQEGANVRYHGLAYSTNSSSQTTRRQAEYQLRTIESHPAYISTGEARRFSNFDRYGNTESTRVDANQGFYVSARLIGNNRVLLDVFVLRDEFGQPISDLAHTTVSTQRLSTTVSGNVGEWIDLGGLLLRDDSDSGDQAKKITSHSQSLANIAIRVNPLP